MTRSRHPFEASLEELTSNIDHYVDLTVGSLQSYYLTMPRGEAFVEYDDFEEAYQELEKQTQRFSNFTFETLRAAVFNDPLVFVVLRCILGFSPPELAHLASETTGIAVSQNQARSIDRQKSA